MKENSNDADEKLNKNKNDKRKKVKTKWKRPKYGGVVGVYVRCGGGVVRAGIKYE